MYFFKSVAASFLLFTLLFCIVSCSSTKKTKYFQDIPDSGRLSVIKKAEFTSPVIEVDDNLSILVQTIDPLATSAINTGNLGLNAAASMTPGLPGTTTAQIIPGYTVAADGTVTLPVLGKLKVEGLTVEQARVILNQQAAKFYNNAVVIIRLANFKVSVTGEVQRPGVYTMPGQKNSIMDALAMAGDLTIYGKRDNILLIRENQDGTKTPYRINLKKSDILTQPYYYLKQNDVIYVEPSKAKAASTDAVQGRNYAIAGSLLSVLVIYLTRK